MAFRIENRDLSLSILDASQGLEAPLTNDLLGLSPGKAGDIAITVPEDSSRGRLFYSDGRQWLEFTSGGTGGDLVGTGPTPPSGLVHFTDLTGKAVGYSATSSIDPVASFICSTLTSFGYQGHAVPGVAGTSLGSKISDSATASFSAIGYSALESLVDGTGNTAVGTYALAANESGDYNTAVGHNALTLCTTSSNVAVGAGALTALTEGSSNSAVGVLSLGGLKTGNGNVAAGSHAGSGIHTGSSNVSIGVETMIGVPSDGSDNDASRNVVIGETAGSALLGNDNVLLGPSSAERLADADGCVSVGSGTLLSLENSGYHTVVGLTALPAYVNTDPSLVSTSVGMGNCNALLTGEVTVVGNLILQAATASTANTAVGIACLDNTANGNRNTVAGAFTARVFVGSDNVVFGNNSMMGLGTKTSNVCLGMRTQAGLGEGTVENIVAIGAGTLETIISGSDAVAIGPRSQENASTTSENVSVGSRTLTENLTGQRLTAVGELTCDKMTTSSDCTAVGQRSQTTATGENNTSLGATACLRVTGHGNTTMGVGAGETLTTGAGNTIMGFGTALTADTSSNCVVMGDGADVAGAGTSNATVIGESATSNTLGVAVGSSSSSATNSGGAPPTAGLAFGNGAAALTGELALGSAAAQLIANASDLGPPTKFFQCRVNNTPYCFPVYTRA